MEIGDCVLLLGGHTGPLTNAAAAADGSLLITTSSDSTARVWELEKGECLHVLTGHTAAVRIGHALTCLLRSFLQSLHCGSFRP